MEALEESAPGCRIERDLLGSLAVPADALYGIHTQRALENFPLAGRPVNRHLVHAYGGVKLACLMANQELEGWDAERYQALQAACRELAEGRLDRHVRVDALQGGAGTSTNMNVNEVIANRALQRLGRPLGDYEYLHPIEDVNRHQSTNDTFPTALRVAAIGQLRVLERAVTRLIDAFQVQERELADVVKIGRTELQDAVPTTLGRSMGAYAEAFARDRWRIYKCEERLRIVNLGGTAIGTGIGAPRHYIFRVVDFLQQLTGLGLARAENLLDATQNADVFVEVSGMIRALGTNLLKISNDLRLLSAGPHSGFGELRLPPRQSGSSIMPGKVNPVIAEAVGQAAVAIAAHDHAISQAAGLGVLELNPFLPLIADHLLESVTLAQNACRIFAEHCITGIQADRYRCREAVETGTAIVTALVGRLGYKVAEDVAQTAAREGKSVKQTVLDAGLLTEEQFVQLVSAEAVTRLGSS